MAYAFDFINIDGTIDHFDLGLFGDDAQAMRQARSALLASTSAKSVDVWHEGRLVGRIRSPHERRRPRRYANLHAAWAGNR